MAIKPTDKIYFNGTFVDWDDAKVHVINPGLHYGYGVFEGIRLYNTYDGPAIFKNRAHAERFLRSAKIYQIDLPDYLDEGALMEAIRETVRRNKIEEGYIRPVAFMGAGDMGINADAPTTVAIAVWPWGSYLGEKGVQEGISAKVSSWTRPDPNSIPLNAKGTGQYVNSRFAKREAVRAGFDEAIMLDHRGFVSEGSAMNLLIVKKGKLLTPPEKASILPGITRETIMDLSKELEIECVEQDLTRSQLYNADEAFFTGTAAEVTPIVNIDGYKVNDGKPGPITRKLQKVYFDVVHGEDPKHDDWLDFVNY